MANILQRLFQVIAADASAAVRPSIGVERAWLVGRLVTAGTCVFGAALLMHGLPGQNYVYACAAFVLAYSVWLAWLLRKGRVKALFAWGFALDNVTVLVGWFGVTSSLQGAVQTNDLYLVLMPLLVIGVVRLGAWLGAVYTLLWMGWLSAMSLYFYGPDSYDVEQLPVRVLIFTTVSLLTGRLVARLNRERQVAETLRNEAAALADASRAASFSLDPTDSLNSVRSALKEVIPADGLALVFIDRQSSTVRGAHCSSFGTGEEVHILVRELGSAVLAARQTGEVSRLDRVEVQGAGRLTAMIARAAETGPKETAYLCAISRLDPFTPRHAELFARVAHYISGAVANAELHARTRELAEERDLRARIDASNRDLVTLDKDRLKFFANLSHEIRNPLTVISGHVDLLLLEKDKGLTPAQADHLLAVQKACGSLGLLLADMKDIATLNLTQFRVRPAVFNATDLLKECAAMMTQSLHLKSQVLSTDLPPASLLVDGDRDRLLQVVLNLLSNASKYSARNSVIHLRGWRDGEHFHISVADSGRGISNEDQQKLFTPFFRAPDAVSSGIEGTGLGLVIVRGIVEAHGGRIHVRSAPGHGSTFEVVLPCVQESLQPATAAAR